MSRTRAGRKSHATHRNWLTAVGDAVAAFAKVEWKYSLADMNKIQITRTVKESGKETTLSLNDFYGELAVWDRKAFAQNKQSEMQFADFLVELFRSPQTTVHTKFCEYRLADLNFQTTVQ